MSESEAHAVDPIPPAFDAQVRACESLGSSAAARVLGALLESYRQGGAVHGLMAGRFARPIHDAAPLRLLGGLHRLVLGDLAPELSQHFPTAGGRPGPNLEQVTIATVESHLDVLDQDLDTPVQTNEIGRSVVHMALCHWLGRLGHAELDFVEVGSSAGLNLNFMRYGADTGHGWMGDQSSTILFAHDWFDIPPPVDGPWAVPVRVVGSDPSPIDPTTNDGSKRLLSFVWPDHLERFERLRTAIEIARRYPPDLRRASAEKIVADVVAAPLMRPTVVFHSITWQYMGTATQEAFVAELHRIGRTATAESPLVWARMEPAGAVADIQATMWLGAETPTDYRLGTIGYHGRAMRWTEPSR